MQDVDIDNMEGCTGYPAGRMIRLFMSGIWPDIRYIMAGYPAIEKVGYI